MKRIRTNTFLFIGLTFISVVQGNKIMGQSQIEFEPSVTEIKVDEHIPEWDFYLSNVDRKLSSLVVDLGLYKIAPIKDKSTFLWISIKMNSAREDGLSSIGEAGLLKEIENNLVTNLDSTVNSIYVGSLTSNSCKDFYFYGNDTISYGSLLTKIMIAYPQYHYNYGLKKDAKWSGYFDFLYPSTQQFQSIQNRRIIDQLERSGDKLTKMRQVNHWIYFKTKKDLDVFLSKIMYDGFALVSKTYDKKSGGLPYKVHITRIDKVDWSSVDAYVFYLWKLAAESNGVYDGWETSVETD